MWCATEVKKALCFIPGYTGFCPEYSQQIGKSYGHQTHHLMREHPHLEGRLSNTGRRPCVRVEIKPDRLERGDSEYEKCATCHYDRDVRPAGLPSEEMWRAMDLEKQRGQRAKEKIARSSPKSYYSRHESHHPSYYPHYEGFRDEHDNNHHEHGHHHHRHYKHSHYHQGHHEHDHHHQEHHDHGYKLNKHKGENPVSVSICIIPRKPKGKFYAPSVCGNYDLEKNKVCIQLPEKHFKKSERSEDRMSYHNHRTKLDRDYANKRYSCLETGSQDQHGRKSHYRSSSKNGAMPHCVGFIGGIQLCGPVNYGNAPGRLWRGSCC